MLKKKWQGTLNGKELVVDIEPSMVLLDLLREHFGLTGTKHGCGEGDCGACSVIVDGKLIDSCITPAFAVFGKNILTIEGLSDGDELHPIQKALLNTGAFQCGYCMPGMSMAIKSLLDTNSNPSEQEIKNAISGNLCRCGSYSLVVEAVKSIGEKGGAKGCRIAT